MGLHIMPSVDLRKMSPQIGLAIQVAVDCFGRWGRDCIITSLTRPGTWDEVMLHGTGNAVDLATRDLKGDPLPDHEVEVILSQLNSVLGRPGGGQFDIVDERKTGASAGWTGAHIHIEFDPK